MSGPKAGLLGCIASSVAITFSLVGATLREIFDESAYARFLARNRLGSSPRTYSEFLREQEVVKARRPRCC
jgi:hypothetical protein